MVIPGTLPLWVGTRNSALNPHTGPSLLETSFTLPQQTQKPRKTTAPDPKKLAHGSPQPGKTMGSPGTLPLWVGIRNSAMTPQYRAKAGKDKFHHTAPDPKSPENYRTGPKKFAQGSHQSGKNTDSPGTVPLMGRHP